MDKVNEHLRITVLRLLEEQADRTLNESLLVDMTPAFGFTPSRDRLRTELAWLAEQGLVDISETNGLLLVTLTVRGEDVALGRCIVPGVKRPDRRR